MENPLRAPNKMKKSVLHSVVSPQTARRQEMPRPPVDDDLWAVIETAVATAEAATQAASGAQADRRSRDAQRHSVRAALGDPLEMLPKESGLVGPG